MTICGGLLLHIDLLFLPSIKSHLPPSPTAALWYYHVCIVGNCAKILAKWLSTNYYKYCCCWSARDNPSNCWSTSKHIINLPVWVLRHVWRWKCQMIINKLLQVLLDAHQPEITPPTVGPNPHSSSIQTCWKA